MEKIFKNKLNGYEETPPDFILENLKNEISGANSNFFSKNKFYIAASIVAIAVVSSLLIFNNKETETPILQANNTTVVVKDTNIEPKPVVIETQDKVITNNAKQENSTVKETTPKLVKTIIEKQIEVNISAGSNVVVCGNTYKMSAKNTSNGKWLANKAVSINNVNSPNTTITSNQTEVNMIWKETVNNTYIFDTVKITFLNYPKSDIRTEQKNELCNNSNAEIKFITDNNYTYNWNDGVETKENYRNNLSANTYSVTVSNNKCKSEYNFSIINNGEIIADFYHTELYSAVNVPFYFTNETKYDEKINDIKYYWNFGDGNYSTQESPEHTYTSKGDYSIKLLAVSSNGCKDSLILKASIDEKEVKMPNIFTPNGDGIHDVLILKPKPLTNYYAVIYDRNGREITHWNDPEIGWNGKLKTGNDALEGVYYYAVSGLDADGNKFVYKSFVHLKR